jgi:hypothetical protein
MMLKNLEVTNSIKYCIHFRIFRIQEVNTFSPRNENNGFHLKYKSIATKKIKAKVRKTKNTWYKTLNKTG